MAVVPHTPAAERRADITRKMGASMGLLPRATDVADLETDLMMHDRLVRQMGQSRKQMVKRINALKSVQL